MLTREEFNRWIELTYNSEERYGGWELMWAPEYVEKDRILNKEEELKALNRKMIEEFPFLMPHNRYSGEPMPEFDYSFNEWQALDYGWQIAWGWEFLHELNIILEGDNIKKDFQIVQIKEKYGTLRFYTNFTTDALNQLIDDYEVKSMNRNLIIFNKKL